MAHAAVKAHAAGSLTGPVRDAQSAMFVTWALGVSITLVAVRGRCASRLSTAREQYDPRETHLDAERC